MAAWFPPARYLRDLGGRYHGTYVSPSATPYATAPNIGRIVNLSNASADYVDFSTPAINGDVTLAFWIAPGLTTSGQYTADFGAGNNFAQIVGYQSGFYNVYNTAYPIGNNAANSQIPATGAGILDLVAWTIRGTQLSGYVNGRRHIQGTITHGSNWTPDAGLRWGRPYTSTSSDFLGQIGPYTIWERALSDGEIAALYSPRFRWDLYETGHRMVSLPASGPSGGAAQTLSAVTQSGTGAQTIPGTAAQTMPPLEQTAAASHGVSGTAAQALPGLTQSATGTQVFTGTGAQALPSIEQSADAVMQPSGTGAQALAAVTQSGTGSVDGDATGTSAQTLPSLEQSANGTQTVSGTSVQTLPAALQSANAIIVAEGTAAQALPAATQAGAGLESVPGSAAQTVPALTQAGVGAMLPAGTSAQTLPAVTQAAAGTGGETPATPGFAAFADGVVRVATLTGSVRGASESGQGYT